MVLSPPGVRYDIITTGKSVFRVASHYSRNPQRYAAVARRWRLQGIVHSMLADFGDLRSPHAKVVYP